MKVGYVRVSSETQHTDRQEALMAELGVDKIYMEKVSGKNAQREQLKAMLDFIREGDMVIVESYSRLARSTRDLLDILEILRNKKVEFVSKKENFDTSTSAGRLMLTVFAGLYQFEREAMLERQGEGIREAKKKGKYKGRTPIKVDWKKFGKLYTEWKSGQRTAVSIQRELGLKPKTFYRRVAEYENKRAGE